MNKRPYCSLADSAEQSPKLHTSMVQVDEAMKEMDNRYNTQFYSWIRNEGNVDYIAYYLQKLLYEVQETPQSMASVIRWLVDGWSIPRIAELLIKLFYHWGIGHPRFALVVSDITQDWSSSNRIDLTVALVLGERASKAAKFLKYLTNNWEPRAIMDSVRQICLRLKWSERYLKHFLIQYMTMCEEEHAHQRMTVSKLRICFESRQNTLNHWCTIDTTGSYETQNSLIEFSMEIFETIVWEMYELRYFRKWNLSCAQEKTCNLEARSSENVPMDVHANKKRLRITTSTEQLMDLRNQAIYEKLTSPQASVPVEYFNGTGII
ncbi:hypothetical protein K493DRAFT_342514 [Basidiobolus meristosporus CBS 931.73]|uniref:Uncharacterized protein n=1 Tax=Basidiobolus meristosporus CBS 931.73 TaxID=1314790 RepID=A0A1Y1X4K6_9FUNG|nr:hypothetical protein K493DRAFT_342514 [Basidiobolus meristosporus CBS 931.73]|eukprot:ORX80751.1 hypothetical protein K493DRAFT_342514 [Basidiobolus meristosporus CBS 931.73]